MDRNKQLDKIRGSLIGGAVGDALGYPVEFINSYMGIQKRYGENGITRLDTTQWWLPDEENSGKAWISDDTQMTLFTACGLLNAKAQGTAPKYAICEAYFEWYYTQIGKRSGRHKDCWIGDVPELNNRRAPGQTCITALQDILRGKDPYNNSKGCGGIMRTAPVALYGAVWRDTPEGEPLEGRISSIMDVDMLAADAAEITHQHPLGWLSSALEAHVIYRILQKDCPTVDDFKAYLSEGYDTLLSLYPNEGASFSQLRALTDKALGLVDSPASDVDNIEAIGEGWVAEETLAIAVYCAVKYFDNFEKAIVASVNHKGDSDSTGAVTGNILGAVVGYDAIPEFFKTDLELHDIILHVADDLWRGRTTKFK
ncbi:ADP-ribosylglycohydrolase family protein [Prevotella sp.]|uniref:ADP-ribosylglycohydrolase family protein n=1 Tax=uncultured Prevotella sp. TaxID=159272 RepID=UPI0027E2A1FD|nr:ADP-ribosylglycohydrolase family protein [uncultured Prevotella sp.]